MLKPLDPSKIKRAGPGCKFYINKEDLRPYCRAKSIVEAMRLLGISCPHVTKRLFIANDLPIPFAMTYKRLRTDKPCEKIKYCSNYREAGAAFGFKSYIAGKKIIEYHGCQIGQPKPLNVKKKRWQNRIWILKKYADRPYQFTADRLRVSINNVVRAYKEYGIKKLDCSGKYGKYAPQTVK